MESQQGVKQMKREKIPKADEKREDPEGWEENYLPYLRRLIQP
jgi:hypothetical protein